MNIILFMDSLLILLPASDCTFSLLVSSRLLKILSSVFESISTERCILLNKKCFIQYMINLRGRDKRTICLTTETWSLIVFNNFSTHVAWHLTGAICILQARSSYIIQFFT